MFFIPLKLTRMPLTLNMDAAQIRATLWAILPVLSKKEAKMELRPKNMVANIVQPTTMVVLNILLPKLLVYSAFLFK
jgi:hypothetical protein